MSRIYDLSQISLLLAEDNDFMAGLLTSMLGALRIGRIIRARDGAEAKDLLQARVGGLAHGPNGVDIILSDWVMEPCDGLDLLKWVRGHQNERIRFLPFIMVTAYPERQRIITARDAGATEFLRKPVKVESVLLRLMEVIERPRPFVKCDTYFGPDRRRKSEPFEGDDRREPGEEDGRQMQQKMAVAEA